MDVIIILKYSKGHNSVNSVGGVMVLILDNVLYLYEVLSKFLTEFQRYRPEQ